MYIAIDLKSFFASVECVERHLDPLTANLVVADASRTEKTICLAVSPSLKKYGIPGRARLFEVVERVKEVNAMNPGEKLDYIVATPHMAKYMKYSTDIYKIYLKYVAPEDIHVYSIDEVFIDVTHYLRTYNMTPRELAMKMILEVLETTGITATAGIGTNLYLCKIAMDIVAKHVPADRDGVRIAELDEMSYRKQLWDYKPLTDFWRVGRGYAKKLEAAGLMTMGDIARCSIGKEQDFYNEDLLYKMFGVNAELLIDHAWGYEPCTIEDIKSYKPDNNSMSSGQVLQSPYPYDKAELIVREMTDLLVLDLISKKLVTDQIVLNIGYDIVSMKNYIGEVVTDFYGRDIPKSAHGSENLGGLTSSTKIIVEAAVRLFRRIANKALYVRRISIAANHVIDEKKAEEGKRYEQLDIFSLMQTENEPDNNKEELRKEKKIQTAMLDIKAKYGKNAILKGMNLKEGGMTIKRNNQIGGHKA